MKRGGQSLNPTAMLEQPEQPASPSVAIAYTAYKTSSGAGRLLDGLCQCRLRNSPFPPPNREARTNLPTAGSCRATQTRDRPAVAAPRKQDTVGTVYQYR